MGCHSEQLKNSVKGLIYRYPSFLRDDKGFFKILVILNAMKNLISRLAKEILFYSSGQYKNVVGW